MENIDGLKVSKLAFIPEKCGDLLYYDGPVLSHFIDKEKPDEHYLYYWVDDNDECNRWLVFKVLEGNLIAFFEGGESLRSLIEYSEILYLLDLDNELDAINIMLVTIEYLAESYLPSTSSNFDPDIYHGYATKLAKALLSKRVESITSKVLLDKVMEIETKQKLILRKLEELSNSSRSSEANNLLFQLLNNSNRRTSYNYESGDLGSFLKTGHINYITETN